MNKVILMGRMTDNPELRFMEGTGNAVTRFVVAINRPYKNAAGNQETDFIRCLAFNKTAEIIANNFEKGNRILLEGAIKTGSYQNSDGNKVYTTDIVVSKVEFIEKKEEKKQQGSKGEEEFFPTDDAEIPF